MPAVTPPIEAAPPAPLPPAPRRYSLMKGTRRASLDLGSIKRQRAVQKDERSRRASVGNEATERSCPASRRGSLSLQTAAASAASAAAGLAAHRLRRSSLAGLSAYLLADVSKDQWKDQWKANELSSEQPAPVQPLATLQSPQGRHSVALENQPPQRRLSATQEVAGMRYSKLCNSSRFIAFERRGSLGASQHRESGQSALNGVGVHHMIPTSGITSRRGSATATRIGLSHSRRGSAASDLLAKSSSTPDVLRASSVGDSSGGETLNGQLLRSLLERRSSCPSIMGFSGRCSSRDLCISADHHGAVRAATPRERGDALESAHCSNLASSITSVANRRGHSVPSPDCQLRATGVPMPHGCQPSTGNAAQPASDEYCKDCCCSSALCNAYDAAPILVLHPLSRLRLYWDMLVSFCALLSLIETPLRIAFASDSAYSRDSLTEALGAFTTVVFVLQPLVETRTIVVHRGTPEGLPSTILCRYLHSPLMITDLLSASAPLLEMLWRPLALIRAVQVIRALRFVHKLEKATKTSPTFVRSAQLLVGALVVLHWIACLFCYLARMDGSWYEHYQDFREITSDNSTNVHIYLHAVYWTLDTASTRGSGDIVVRSDLEMGVMCLVIALSTLLYSAIIANMSTLLLSSDSTWNDHRRREEVLKAFMRSRKLPTRLRQRIQNFLDYMWATQKGIDEGQILKELPETLQKQVTLFCAQHVIDRVPLFRGCPPDVSASIISELQPRVYVPQDIIIEKGAWGDEFFIINEGVVIALPSDSGGMPLYLHPGSYFGELAALLGGRRQQTTMALTHCNLYSLKVRFRARCMLCF